MGFYSEVNSDNYIGIVSLGCGVSKQYLVIIPEEREKHGSETASVTVAMYLHLAAM